MRSSISNESGPDAVRMYLNEIGQVDLLNAEDERRLGKLIKDGIAAQAVLDADAGNLAGQVAADVLDAALAQAKPEIFNSDQGSQFTASTFTSRLESRGIAISMDGRGRYLDNIFIERLWRSVKQEKIYRYDFETIEEVEEALAEYFEYYNNERLHQSFDYLTPAQVFYGYKKPDRN